MTPFLAALAVTLAAGERPWVDAGPGVHVGAPVVLAAAGRTPIIAPLGDGFVAAWLQSDPDGPQRGCIAGARLSAQGRPASPARVILCGPLVTQPAIAAAGNRVALVWGVAGGIEGRILSADLAPLAELHQALPRQPERVSASHDGSAFVAAWSTYDSAAALSFGPDGAILRGPERVAGPSSQPDVTHADVACVPSGTCAVLFRQFYGNSRTSTGSARLERGAVEGGFGGSAGPFEQVAIAGAGQLLRFESTYDRLWGVSLLAGNAPIFDFQTSDHRIRDLAGAAGQEGTLIAWWMEPREGSRTGVSIAYIHPDPNAARPHPLVIPNVISPAVATLDGRRFVLLSGTFAGGVRAQLVEVEPSKFGKSPEQRGNVVEGTVLGPDGRPPSGANVACFLVLRDGSLSSTTTMVGPEGRFFVHHPRQGDLRATAGVSRLLCWARDEVNASPLFDGEPAAGTPLTLQLQPQAAAARVRLTALEASGEGRYPDDLQVLLAPGVRNQLGLHRLGKGRALELDDVAPGPTVVSLFDPQGFQVTHRLQLQPGADHLIEIPFALELPPGKVGLVLNDALAVLGVPPGAPAQQAGVRKGDVVVAVNGQHPKDRSEAIELMGGAPGTPVEVTVRRSGTGAMASVRILRSSPGKAPAPRVTVSPRSARKESQLIQPGPGERILAEAAVLEPAAEGPFRVDVDEAIAFPGTARVRVTIPAEIHEAGAIQLAVTVDGPGDLHETRRAAYYNVHRVTVGCDPVPGGGPDQCRNNSWEEPLSPPSIDFGPELLNTPGPHHLAVQAPGFGEVRRTFLLVAPALERSLQVHQHRELGSYRLQARAAVVVPAATGSRPLTVSRALFRSGGRTLIVDVSDPGRTREELDAMLSTGPWAAVPWTTARDQRAIKLSRRPDGFEAAWASDLLVRAAGTGGALGDAERTVLDYYLGAFPSRQPASR